MSIFVILMLVAVLCFGLAVGNVSSRINLVALGMMFMALAFVLNASMIL